MGSAPTSPRIRPSIRRFVFSTAAAIPVGLDFEIRKNGARRPLVWDEPLSETAILGTAEQGKNHG